MKPVRIKVYGLVSLTKLTYLRIQGFGLVVVLSLLVAGGSLMYVSGQWRPVFPPRDIPSAVILFFWIALATLLLEVVETTLVLRKFAEAEARQRAEEAAVNPPVPRTESPTAVQLPSPVQTAPFSEHNIQS
jgi:hypothetical protein